MTSEAYVWQWLPGHTDPVVAGAVRRVGDVRVFGYARSYLARDEALAIGPDLPLQPGPQHPGDGLDLAGVLRDALPDAWGQRVLLDRATGRRGCDADPADLSYEWFMLESGSQRFGALDFQASATEYVPRGEPASLDDLYRAAEILDRGAELPPSLDAAIRHGTSVGGARPKAQLVGEDGVHWIAKFSSSTDTAPTVQIEAAALHLADRAGLDVPEHRLVDSIGKKALLVRRFDRDEHGGRRGAVSMLTSLRLTEMTGRYASYPEFLDALDATAADRHELFGRVALNIAVGNVDDHARNHAAYWDGDRLSLAPVYDIDPTSRPGEWDTNQAIAYGRDGARASNLAALRDAHADYGLSKRDAEDAIGGIVDAIETRWDDAVEFAELSRRDAERIRERAILHPAAMEGFAMGINR
ncbi:MAG: type II toxin-antitoxin system HipA family toxin [Microbacteriaceae bacterium]